MPFDSQTLGLHTTDVPGYPKRSGKVRDVYDLGEHLVVIATDRISAFDWIMPEAIPGKGVWLTAMTEFWLRWLAVPNHATNLPLPAAFAEYADRAMLVKKTRVIPYECVARGYLAGSAWAEYRTRGTVCDQPLKRGLRESERLPTVLFTPATKAESGHDVNVSFAVMADDIGLSLAEELRTRTLDVYTRSAEYAQSQGLILADTKLEWGTLPSGEVILIDEVLTPDSSRYWDAESYSPGTRPASFDKQYLRDWLDASGWDKASPPPHLPAEVIAQTSAKYREALHRLTASSG